MHVAIYASIVAAWNTKYAYSRPRPNAVKRDLRTAGFTPPSPSYPAEHAVAAGAASEVLAYLFPDRAQFYSDQAAEAARSRMVAGIHYRSDIDAGDRKSTRLDSSHRGSA